MCTAVRLVNRQVIRSIETNDAEVLGWLQRWGADAVEIYTDGSYASKKTLCQHLAAGALEVKYTNDGNWSAIHLKQIGASPHQSCFTVELMSLLCALTLVGGNSVRRSVSQAAIGSIKSYREKRKMSNEFGHLAINLDKADGKEVRWIASHPELTAQVADFTKEQLGIYLADKVAGGDYASYLWRRVEGNLGAQDFGYTYER